MEILKPKVKRERNISPSALHYIDPLREDSPQNFKKYLDGELEITETDSMMYGTAAHAYMLEKKRVVSIGNIKYPPEAISPIIAALLNADDMDMSVDSLGTPDAKKFIADYIEQKGVKYANYKPETLLNFIVTSFDDFYKFQKKHRGTDVILVNDQELSIVADAAAFFQNNPTYKAISEEDKSLGEVVLHETYIKVPLDIHGLDKPAAVKIDLIKYSPQTKVIHITDLKLTSLGVRQFLENFETDRKNIQFGFYGFEEIQEEIKNILGIPADEEITFHYWVAMYSRTKKAGAVLTFESSQFDRYVQQAKSLVRLVALHYQSNEWSASFCTDNKYFNEALDSYLCFYE